MRGTAQVSFHDFSQLHSRLRVVEIHRVPVAASVLDDKSDRETTYSSDDTQPVKETLQYYELAVEKVGAILYVLSMVAVIFGVDVLFFHQFFLKRLMVNVGIVAVFAAFYRVFLKRA